MEGVVKHWNRQLREIVESSYLEGLKIDVELALRDFV